MKDDDVTEGLAENAVEPTNEGLDKIEKQGIRLSDESQPKTPRNCPSNSSQNTGMEFCLGKVVSDMEACGPMPEQSL